MSKEFLVAVPIVILLLLGGFWYYASREPMQKPSTTTDGYSTSTAPSTPSASQNQPQVIANQNKMQATLKTNKGDITIEFFGNDAPKTVENFTKLAGQGYYNSTKFHRVIAGFMLQGGDPLTKDDSLVSRWGTGGPGYQFADEIHANNHNNIGTIAMANAGPNTNGSQFFINVANNNFLDTKHTVFGKVVTGMDVVKAIEAIPTGQGDRPTTPVIIESVTLK